MIKLRRVYDGKTKADGLRILVDRLWPRGLKKEQAGIDEWAKEVSPSTALRRWFNHDPARWQEFKKRYFTELGEQQGAVSKLAEQARRRTVTLVYSAKDALHNNAIALKEYLEKPWLGC